MQRRDRLPVRRDEGCRCTWGPNERCPIWSPACTADDGETGELTRLRAEVALLRDELATAPQGRGDVSTPGWPRCAPPATLPRTPRLVLSQALADRLRIDGTRHGPQAQPLARRTPAPTARGAAAAGADPLLAAVRRRVVPPQLPRRGPLRRRAGPALPAPPHPADPRARPRLRHGPLPRRPSRGAGRGGQPARALPALARRADGPTATHRGPDDGRTRLETGRRRCADFLAALARLRPALAARRPRRPGPGPPAGRAGPRRGVARAAHQQAASRPRRRAALRDGRRAGERRSSTRRGTSRPTGSPPVDRRQVDPLLHFVDEGWRDLRAPSLDFDLWWYTCSYLDPTAEEVNPLLHYLLVGPPRGARARARSRAGRAPRPATPRGNGRAAPACSPATTATGSSTTTSCTTCASWPGYADVFYLADGVLEPGELDKLDGHRRGGLEHPARGLRLRLVVAAGPRPRGLGPARRLRRGRSSPTTAASWCGPSTTSSREMDCSRLRLVEPPGHLDGVQRGRRRRRTPRCRSTQARRELIGPRRWSDVLYLHLSSYFLVLRRPVLDDAGLPLPARHASAASAPSSSWSTSTRSASVAT